MNTFGMHYIVPVLGFIILTVLSIMAYKKSNASIVKLLIIAFAIQLFGLLLLRLQIRGVYRIITNIYFLSNIAYMLILAVFLFKFPDAISSGEISPITPQETPEKTEEKKPEEVAPKPIEKVEAPDVKSAMVKERIGELKGIKYAVAPEFIIRRKLGIIDYAYIEEQFRNWIQSYTQEGYVIGRETTISAIIEPGCLGRLLREKIGFYDFATFEFHKSDEVINYLYRISPIFPVKARRLPRKEKKLNKADRIQLQLEYQREEFQSLISDYVNSISAQGYEYNTSRLLAVVIKPGCIGMLRGKEREEINFETCEFVKTQNPVEYKCRIFPRYRVKESRFSFNEFENYVSSQVQEEMKGGFTLVGKIKFGGFIKSGCLGMLGMGKLITADAFMFRKV